MRIINILALISLLVGCSLIKKSALNMTSKLMMEGSDEVFTEGDLSYFKKAAPGNIKMIEGLWFGDQDNEELLFMLIKSHAGHTFASLETEAYSDIILDKASNKLNQTIMGYQKAIYYGYHFLELKGISKQEFLAKEFVNKLPDVFSQKIKESDYPAIFYFAEALGSSINLQRQNVSKMALLGHVRKMLAWVCAQKPDLENGNCKLFNAVIEASTPTLLGGSIAKAKEMFLTLQKENPENLLIQLCYIQFYLLPLLEEDEYLIAMRKLKKELDLWYELQLGNESSLNKKYLKKKQFNLYNAIAYDRYKKLKEIEKDLF